MTIWIGGKKVGRVRVGDGTVSKVMLGDTQVWPLEGGGEPPGPPEPVACPIGGADWTTTNKFNPDWLIANAAQFGGCTDFTDAWFGTTTNSSFYMPWIDTSNGTVFFKTWRGRKEAAFTNFPALDMRKGTDLVNCWRDCAKLVTMGDVQLRDALNLETTWRGCTVLANFPQVDTSNVTRFMGTWQSCPAITDFPLLDYSSGTEFALCWSGCTSLTPLGVENILVGLDASGVTGKATVITGHSAKLTPAGSAAKASLLGKGWTISD